MTGFLLDTNILLWFLEDSPRLRPTLRDDIAAEKSLVTASVISIWETSIKQSINKLRTVNNLDEIIERNGFTILPVKAAHAIQVRDLPYHHRDPFDRMLIAQAKCEKLTLITSDTIMQQYDAKVIVN